MERSHQSEEWTMVNSFSDGKISKISQDDIFISKIMLI
jgi:hypothetical protein